VFKLFTSVQLVPFHCSVFAVEPGVSPPIAKAAVFVVPQLPKFLLGSFKSPNSVQVLPFQDSVKPCGVSPGAPAKTNPAVCVPADPPAP
jgi:hypothetical protein